VEHPHPPIETLVVSVKGAKMTMALMLDTSIVLADRVRQGYLKGQTDYSFEPIVITDATGSPVGRVSDGDDVVFCCRRGEREIQLTEAFTQPEFLHFPRKKFDDLNFIILTLYHEKFKDLPVAFAPTRIESTLAEVISRANLRQLHLAESEKFAHVTFFFNGGSNQRFAGEEDVCIPSPKGIPYEQVPQLSLPQVTEQVLAGIQQGYDFIVTNFANGDVIGHTQNRAAKIACAKSMDDHLGKVISAAQTAGYVVLVTADHGNLEELNNGDGTPGVSHTTNPVACVLIDPRATRPVNLKDGILADVAPTILDALGIPSPDAMTGVSLAPEHDWHGARRVLLLILDGWGIGSQDENNPIFLAPTPVWDDLLSRYPNSQLQAAGGAVGLQPGKAGNSEAGHLNLGAGRVVVQDDVRLDHAMQDGSFYHNEILCNAIRQVREKGTNLHLIGLLTEKSSHGSIDYPLALLRMAKANGLNNVFVHLIFDGRSTEPGSAPALIEKMAFQMQEIGIGQIVTGMGRGIALDRDGNYAKTRRAYEALVYGEAY
jgi:2,3-bisphosphoglycerate-independent phosphoglycerate mutase